MFLASSYLMGLVAPHMKTLEVGNSRWRIQLIRIECQLIEIVKQDSTNNATILTMLNAFVLCFILI